MNLLRKFLMSSIIIFGVSACGGGLSTKAVPEIAMDISLFTVILYGMETPYDVETIAILDRADDSFQIIPDGSKHNYRIHADLEAEKALAKVQEFFQRSVILSRIEKREISGPEGQILGYEIRPLFMPSQVGSDRLHTSYYLKEDNIVRSYVTWMEFQKPFEGNGSDETTVDH